MSGALIWEITARTFLVGLVATGLAAVPGIAAGYWLARRSFRGKALVHTLLALPLVLPPVAVGLALLLLLSPRYAPGRLLSQTLGWSLLYTWQAAALAAAIMAFPLLLRACEQAFAAVPRRLEQVAATLGASPGRVFFTVSLPLARRGVASGLLIGFARGLGEFGATSLVAGYIPGETETLALGIYHQIQNGRDGAALALMGVSLALAFSATWTAERLLRDRETA